MSFRFKGYIFLQDTDIRFPDYSTSISHRIGGSLKLLRESTNANRKWLKIAFSTANCRFRLPICNLKHCLTLIDLRYTTLATLHDCCLSGVYLSLGGAKVCVCVCIRV